MSMRNWKKDYKGHEDDPQNKIYNVILYRPFMSIDHSQR